MIVLNGKNNPQIKEAQKLLDRRERKKSGRFLLEGARLCEDAALNGIAVEKAFFTEEAAGKYESVFALMQRKADEVFLIGEENARRLADTENSQNVFAVCRKKEGVPALDPAGMYVLLDNVQNPDNLGAVVRTAEAFGADGLIVCSGCDVYSPKALRASMGALLRFPVIAKASAAEAAAECAAAGMRVFATVPDRTAKDITRADKSGGAVLVIGNEGSGVSEEVLALCTEKITIPMKGKAESLNAAAAAAVSVWEFMKER